MKTNLKTNPYEIAEGFRKLALELEGSCHILSICPPAFMTPADVAGLVSRIRHVAGRLRGISDMTLLATAERHGP